MNRGNLSSGKAFRETGQALERAGMRMANETKFMETCSARY